jgi:hypothetical protein
MSTVIAILGSVVAFAAGALVWWPWQRGNVRASIFTDQIIKLANAGNLRRALKLCGAAPDSVYVTATAHAIKSVGDVPVDPARDAETVALVREQFHAHLQPVVRRMQRGNLQLIAMLGCAVTGAGIATGAPPWTAAGAGAAVLMLIASYRLARGVARAAIDDGERMFPAIAQGRGSLHDG